MSANIQEWLGALSSAVRFIERNVQSERQPPVIASLLSLSAHLKANPDLAGRDVAYDMFKACVKATCEYCDMMNLWIHPDTHTEGGTTHYHQRVATNVSLSEKCAASGMRNASPVYSDRLNAERLVKWQKKQEQQENILRRLNEIAEARQ